MLLGKLRVSRATIVGVFLGISGVSYYVYAFAEFDELFWFYMLPARMWQVWVYINIMTSLTPLL